MNQPIMKAAVFVCTCLFILCGSAITGAAQSGTALYISPAAVVLVQQQLNQQGFELQEVEGTWGASASRAVRAFQQKKGLDPSGNLNVETIRALGLPQVLNGTVERKDPKVTQQLSASKGAQLYISPSNIRRIQQNLIQQKLYSGKVDGVLGPATQRAIRQYEQEKGLETTGNINLRLINTLGLNQMLAGLAAEASPGQKQGQTGWQKMSGQEARGYYGQAPQRAGNGAPLYVSPLAVRQIQMVLKQNGYDAGPIDGQWGRNTGRAVEQFQQARNLEPTGNLNITTARIMLGGFELDSLPMGTSGPEQERQNQQPR